MNILSNRMYIAETYVCKLFTKGMIKTLSEKSIDSSELQFAFKSKMVCFYEF